MDPRLTSRGIAAQWRLCPFFHQSPPPQPESVSAPRSESSFRFPPGAQQAHPIVRCRCLPLDAHFGPTGAFKLDHALLLRRDQLDERRLGCLTPDDGDSTQSFFQTHIVEPQWVRDGIYAVLSGQFDRSPVSYTHLTLPTNREV